MRWTELGQYLSSISLGLGLQMSRIFIVARLEQVVTLGNVLKGVVERVRLALILMLR